MSTISLCPNGHRPIAKHASSTHSPNHDHWRICGAGAAKVAVHNDRGTPNCCAKCAVTNHHCVCAHHWWTTPGSNLKLFGRRAISICRLRCTRRQSKNTRFFPQTQPFLGDQNGALAFSENVTSNWQSSRLKTWDEGQSSRSANVSNSHYLHRRNSEKVNATVPRNQVADYPMVADSCAASKS